MPDQIGKYRIDAVLGKGAMGVVYKAFDPHIERVVALKTIRKELLQDGQEQELVARFKNEAQASGRLTHPNIVAVYDYGETVETAFISMEYVEGTPLSALLVADQPTELNRVMVWMTQLLKGLGYAHAKGVVHRDIKPANLIITADGELKITDFGIARIESSTLTQTGSMIGTPSYMSPEQFRGAEIDGRSDVFSAGIVLYQLLTGLRPFTGSASIVMQQILNEMPALPSSLQAPFGRAFDEVLIRALTKRPVDRFATAQAFMDALVQSHQDERQGTLPHDVATLLNDDDRTMLAGQIKHATRFRSDGYPSPAWNTQHPASHASASVATMTPWKIEVMPELERVLSRQIGPMAKLLLKKASSKAEDLDTLCSLVTVHIPSASGKTEFQDTVNALKTKHPGSGASSKNAMLTASLGATPPGTNARSVSGELTDDAIDPDVAAKIEQILTRYIGAIAKVVVRRTLAKTASKADLLAQLALQIEKSAERSKFLEEASKG